MNPFEDVPSSDDHTASGDDVLVTGDVTIPTSDRPVTTLPDGGADPCGAATDCASCTAGSSCGWCDGRCQTGTGSGPVSGTCGGAWAWTSGQCSSTPPGDAGSPVSAACTSCGQSMCGPQIAACAGDTSCIQCLAAPTGSCLDNSTFSALAECVCSTGASGCFEQCNALCDRL